MADVTFRFMGSTPNPERFKELIAALAVRLDAYDKILAKQKYLAGDVRFPSSIYPGFTPH